MRMLEEVLHEVRIKTRIQPTGIVDGPYGSWLLDHFRYWNSSSDLIRDKLHGKMNQMTRAFNDSPHFDYSLGYGITGFLWVMNRLVSDPVIYRKIISYDTIMPEIEAECTRLILDDRFDLFRGANGLMMYLMSVNSLSPKLYDLYIESLLNRLTHSGDLIKFSGLTPNGIEEDGIDLGVSHGVCGCLFTIARLYEFRKHPRCLELLENAIPYYILKRKELPNGKYRFTYSDHTESKVAPLGWCYGDLIAGLCITRVGKMLDNPEFTKKGIEILDSTLDRNDYSTGDLSLCHGSISAAYIYHKAWLLTRIERYLERREVWKRKTKDLVKALETNRAFSDAKFDSRKRDSLVYGYTGTLLAWRTMKGANSVEWDEWMML